jgi:hypothetical protein
MRNVRTPPPNHRLASPETGLSWPTRGGADIDHHGVGEPTDKAARVETGAEYEEWTGKRRARLRHRAVVLGDERRGDADLIAFENAMSVAKIGQAAFSSPAFSRSRDSGRIRRAACGVGAPAAKSSAARFSWLGSSGERSGDPTCARPSSGAPGDGGLSAA